MKPIIIFIVITIVTYLLLTSIQFLMWCNSRQLSLFVDNNLQNLEPELIEYKITGMGGWSISNPDTIRSLVFYFFIYTAIFISMCRIKYYKDKKKIIKE